MAQGTRFHPEPSIVITVSVHDSLSIFPSLQCSRDGYFMFASPKPLNLYILPSIITIWEHFMPYISVIFSVINQCVHPIIRRH